MSLFHMIQVPFREMPFRLFWATGLYIFPPIPLLARFVVIYIFQRNKSGPLSSYYSSLGLPSSTSNHRTYVNCFMYPYSFFPCDRLPYNPTALPLDGVVLSQKKKKTCTEVPISRSYRETLLQSVARSTCHHSTLLEVVEDVYCLVNKQ